MRKIKCLGKQLHKGGGAGTKGKSFPYSVVYMYVQNKVGTLQSRKIGKGVRTIHNLPRIFQFTGRIILPQFDKYSATFCWLLALAIAIAVFPFFDFNLKSAPCKTKYFTQVRWPFLAATCSGMQPDMSGNSISPPCWISSLRTSRCPFAAALCTAVEPDSSNSFGLWNKCYNLPYSNKIQVQTEQINAWS